MNLAQGNRSLLQKHDQRRPHSQGLERTAGFRGSGRLPIKVLWLRSG